MKQKVAINGFGRIGRLVFRKLVEHPGLELVAINDIAPLDNLAYLLKYDSVQAAPRAEISVTENTLTWDGKSIRFLNERNPADLPWQEMGVEIVVDCSGVFTKREAAAQHLQAGAQQVIISAPGKGVDLTICMGVNEEQYEPGKHQVISNASCTTNCLAPVAKVLNDSFGIHSGLLTTVHAYTTSQAIVDAPAKKWRRGRAGAVSIVPTTTGAAIATTEVLPELKGKIDGLALRVPVPTGSIIDFTAVVDKAVTVEQVNQAFQQAAGTEKMRGILGLTQEELVSADIIGSEFSALVDGTSTMVINDTTVKVLAWYDNEWGYATRVVDATAYVASRMSETVAA